MARGATVAVAGQSVEAAAVALSGAYAGHFFLQVAGKAQPVKVEEKTMSLEFVPNAAGDLNVRGFGKNKYGYFDIQGTCSADRSDLVMYVLSFGVVS